MRNNLIRVPSCDIHNLHKTKDDEYLLFVLISHFQNNEVCQQQILTKFIRALKRKPHLASLFLKEYRGAIVNGKKTIAYKVDDERFNKSIEHVAKGIFYSHFKQKWVYPFNVVSFAFYKIDDPDFNKYVQNGFIKILESFEKDKAIGANPQVFKYKIHRSYDPDICLILMTFYEGFHVIAASQKV